MSSLLLQASNSLLDTQDVGDEGDDACSGGALSEYNQQLSIGAVFIILVASLLGTFLPLLFKRYPRLLIWPFVIVIGKHIGTGVLLALCLIHLITPAFRSLGDPCLPDAWQNYEFAPLFALLAALGMHLIETSVLEYTVYRHQSPGHGHSHCPDTPSIPPNDKHNGTKENYAEIAGSVDTGGHSPTQSALREISNVDTLQMAQMAQMECSPSSPSPKHDRYQDPATLKADFEKDQALTKVGEIHTKEVVVAIDPPSDSNQSSLSSMLSHGHSHGILLSCNTERTIGAYILEFGLTSHSIIVGITLGVASQSDQTSLIPALTFHQFFEGFALGARLASIGFGGWTEIMLTCIYSFSAPLGIAIGIGIVNTYNAASISALIVEGTFDSISAGILMYVAFVQMLGLEFPSDYKNCGSSKLKKISLFVGMYIGAGVMALIGNWL